MMSAATMSSVFRIVPLRIVLAMSLFAAAILAPGTETASGADDARWVHVPLYQSGSASKDSYRYRKVFSYTADKTPKAKSPINLTLPGQQPSDDTTIVADEESRFRIADSFRLESVFDAKQTGSLIAMTFDDTGQILASRENGPLLRMIDSNLDGLLDKTTIYCKAVKNCQGILSLGGRVFVVGEGPEGPGLYRLHDADQNGVIQIVDNGPRKDSGPANVASDEIKRLLKFNSKMVEHGAHGLTLGPDGLIYIVLGNLATVEKKAEKTSPYHGAYDGDLVQPRHQDPGGHARGVNGPGGTIIRTDPDGEMVETFAGGFRNPYDLAFNKQGDLITHDADMEWDEGLPWHRPTRVLHVAAGGEFGWRSGWAKWPSYYIDSLPATLATGGGSPAGMAVYNHFMYPTSLHNAMFVSDWATGRILVIRFTPSGASYKARSEVFLEGRPLNATDLAVGPDGWLYFCTGGRDTEGGIYRVVWKGNVPESITNLGTGIAAAIRQPQLNSAWARNRITQIRQQLGAQWGPKLVAIAKNTSAAAENRVRALDLMQLFGPAPSQELLIGLARDPNTSVRAKVAYYLGIHGTADSTAALTRLAADPDAGVGRHAIEAFTRSGQSIAIRLLAKALSSEDRHLSWAARRALERTPIEQWKQTILGTSNQRVFIQGAVALLTVEPSPESAALILDRSGQMMKQYLKDEDFVNLLRVMQLALLYATETDDELGPLTAQLAAEFPSRSAPINREVVRLLVHLQETSAKDRMISFLTSADQKITEKIHLAMHLVRLDVEWDKTQKNEILTFLEMARGVKGGKNLGRYIERSSMEFGARLTEQERLTVLAAGKQWPNAALASLARLSNKPNSETIPLLMKLDGQIEELDTEAAGRLQIGIVAILSQSGDPIAMAYLRGVFKTKPERRSSVAMGLAQDPNGENWPLLIESLPILDGVAAQEVLTRLTQSDRKANKPEAFRQVILRGLQLKRYGGKKAIALLEKWTGQSLSEPDEPIEAALAHWQKWFAEKYPHTPAATLPVDSQGNAWNYEQLLQYLTKGEGTKGSAVRGQFVFANAQCIKCHQHGNNGESIGPNLTNVSRRFQKKEILQSILFPSHVISDQYASKTILTVDGQTHSGMINQGPDGSMTILTPLGRKVTLSRDEIDLIAPSALSAMPEGLLNDLTLEQVADLFAYLNRSPAVSVSRRNTGQDTKK